MKRRVETNRSTALTACILLLLAEAPVCLRAEGPSQAASAAYDSYCQQVEARLARQHQSQTVFIAPPASPGDNEARLRRGEFIIEQLTPMNAAVGNALMHHWRATAFVPGATVSDFLQLMQDYSSFPQRFSPQVLAAKLVSESGGHRQVWMRVRQTHVITVVMDTTYDVTWTKMDSQRGYSISHSTKISEIDNPGTRSEQSLDAADGHGFLWRQNTYWTYEERGGGLYLQVESVSLTRAIPYGLDWIIGPYVKSVPRESLEFTLRCVYNALRRPTTH